MAKLLEAPSITVSNKFCMFLLSVMIYDENMKVRLMSCGGLSERFLTLY